jgi:hypothetical protein
MKAIVRVSEAILFETNHISEETKKRGKTCW